MGFRHPLFGLSVGVMIATELYIEFGISFGVNYLVFFLYAWPQHTEYLYDFTGMMTFISVTLYSFFGSGARNGHEQWTNARNIILSAMVLIWTLRLGSFLFQRIRGEGGSDGRFDPVRNCFPRFFMMWTLQGVWVYWVTLPMTYANGKAYGDSKLIASDYIGWFLWVFGFAFEALGDYQKTEFKEDPKNRGKFINVGLWKYTRHPNYFGEIVLWCGLTISALGIAKDWGFLMFLCPVWTATLLCVLSGIPPTEKRADSKFGGKPDYEEYKRNTPVLIPFCICWR